MAHNSPFSAEGGQKSKTRTVVKNPRGQKKAFTAAQVTDLTERLQEDAHNPELPEATVRNLALFRVAVCSMLRASDLLALKLADVWDFEYGVRPEFTVPQKKTGRAITCYLSERTQQALNGWLHVDNGAALYLQPTDPSEAIVTIKNYSVFAISDRQYRNIVRSWAKRLGLNPDFYSTHSMRRTKAKEVYAQTKDIETVRRALGHNSIETTRLYLGVEKEEVEKKLRGVEI